MLKYKYAVESRSQENSTERDQGVTVKMKRDVFSIHYYTKAEIL